MSILTNDFNAPGYEKLAAVLSRAFDQAARGKGKDRHAQADEPFDKQVMADMAKRFGVGALLGQAFKKSEESQRLPHDRAVAELLGAINYLAGAVIAMEGARVAAAPETITNAEGLRLGSLVPVFKHDHVASYYEAAIVELACLLRDKKFVDDVMFDKLLLASNSDREVQIEILART